MKQLFYLLFLISPFLLLANEINPKLKVKEATVYLSGAQLNCESNVNLSAGKNTIIFKGLSPNIDSNSIQISGLNDVTISSINYEINYLEKKELVAEVEELQNKLEIKNREIAFLRNRISGLQEEEALLKVNKQINTVEQSSSIEKLSTYAAYYRKEVSRIQNEIYDINQEIAKLNKDVSSIQQEINKVRSDYSENRGEIILTLDAPKATNLSLNVKYVVTNAGWYPTYDIKTDNTNQPLSFHYKANVFQNTGNDWENIKIILSTGDPALNTEKPVLDPHYLNFVNRYYRAQANYNDSNYRYNPSIKRVSGYVVDDQGMVLPGVNVIIEGTTIGTQTDFDGRYSIEIQDGQNLVYSYVGFNTRKLPVYSSQMNVNLEAGSQLEEVVVTAYGSRRKNRAAADMSMEMIEEETKTPEVQKEDNITNKLFRITKPYTIPSSGDITMVEIDNFNIAADYEYFSAPVLQQKVYLTAKLEEWENFDLLPGEAKIYFNGNYAGKTFIDPFSVEEDFVVSLGEDPSLVVEREEVNDLKDKSFFGNTRIVNKTYKLTLKNNKNIPVEVTMVDRVPISQNKEIEVDDVEVGNSDYKKDTGILTWKVNLSANGKQERQFSYVVKFPKDKKINLN